MLDPGILDSGLDHLTKEKREEILAQKNAKREAEGKKPQKELTAKDYLKEREYPILVIYPIELLTEVTSNEVKARFGCDTDEYRKIIKQEKEQLCDLFGDIPLMAFAVAFPDKESPKRFTYRANLQKLKELTENLEVTDDEEGEDDSDD